MSCKCEDPRVLRAIIANTNDYNEAGVILLDHCIGYHLVDGHDSFALLGLSNEEKKELNGYGWVQIEKSYLWVKE